MPLFPRRRDDQNFNADDNDEEHDGREPFFRRRGFLLGVGVVLLLVIGLGCWVAIGAFKAKSNLEAARTSAQSAKDALLEGNTDAASASASDAVGHAQAARDATHSIAWDIAAAIPWVGSPFETGQQVTEVVLGLASDVLRPAADVGLTISPGQLYKDGRVDVQLLRSQEPQLAELSTQATRLNGDAAAIADPRYVSLMSNARTQLQGQISEITSLINSVALAARLAPSMMGAEGPRTYFMAFQTNAELRGTGGLLGGYGILRFDNGLPSVDNLAPNTDLADAVAPLDLGEEFDQQYGYLQPFTDFRNSNYSPHFPFAAQIWRGMWLEETGLEVDGAIAIDPVALSYILGAVGSVTMPDGEVVSADNVVKLTESVAYSRFPTDQVARKQYLQDIASAVVAKMTSPVDAPRKLLEALGRAVGERRIAIWSANSAEQSDLEKTPLAHVLPSGPAPYAGVVVNNLGGNKLDYYLTKELRYSGGACTAETRPTEVSLRLTSEVPNEPLPAYVTNLAGLSPELGLTLPEGTNVTSVRLFATAGSELSRATLNGEQVPAILNSERGHPVFELQVIITPGQTANISFELSEPTAAGTPSMPVQPFVNTTVPEIMVPECSS